MRHVACARISADIRHPAVAYPFNLLLILPHIISVLPPNYIGMRREPGKITMSLFSTNLVTCPPKARSWGVLEI